MSEKGSRFIALGKKGKQMRKGNEMICVVLRNELSPPL